MCDSLRTSIFFFRRDVCGFKRIFQNIIKFNGRSVSIHQKFPWASSYAEMRAPYPVRCSQFRSRIGTLVGGQIFIKPVFFYTGRVINISPSSKMPLPEMARSVSGLLENISYRHIFRRKKIPLFMKTIRLARMQIRVYPGFKREQTGIQAAREGELTGAAE